MIKREDGFSLVELIITMAVFVLVIAAASQVFTGLLTQFKQQSKIAETNIEGIVGLEILRQDIEHAGYGLPWFGLIAYNEADGNPYSLNDSTATAAPRAILSKNNATFTGLNNIFDGSDYLVIKAVNVGRNDACQKWTTLKVAPFTSPYNPREWTPASENLASTDRVIVLSPGSTDANARTLVVDGPNFYTTFGNVTNSPWPPTDASETRIVYGVDPDTTLRMPFNRADYFIRRFDSDGNNITPGRCAPNTGMLEKVVINQSDGRRTNFLPLLDCVADMQVIFGLDRNNNGIIGTYTDGDTDITWPSGTPDESADHSDVTATFSTAANLRQRVKEVRVYILAHEGQRDVNHTFNSFTAGACATCIRVGEFGLGRDFNLSTITPGNTEYLNYRWKIYTIVLKPTNLR